MYHLYVEKNFEDMLLKYNTRTYNEKWSFTIIYCEVILLALLCLLYIIANQVVNKVGTPFSPLPSLRVLHSPRAEGSPSSAASASLGRPAATQPAHWARAVDATARVSRLRFQGARDSSTPSSLLQAAAEPQSRPWRLACAEFPSQGPILRSVRGSLALWMPVIHAGYPYPLPVVGNGLLP